MTANTYPGLTALIADLAESEEERVLMDRVAELLPFSAAPADPPSHLFSRVLDRIEAETGPASFEKNGFFFARGSKLPLLPYPGDNQVQVLWMDHATGARAVLVRMPPNAPFPAHGHDHIEDLYVVEGEATLAGVTMRAGDYCRAPKDTEHTDMRSGPFGAVAFVVQR